MFFVKILLNISPHFFSFVVSLSLFIPVFSHDVIKFSFPVFLTHLILFLLILLNLFSIMIMFLHSLAELLVNLLRFIFLFLVQVVQILLNFDPF